ncbi:MAG: enoyl-CoA hydratase-related protein [Deltaproteobacteria bacterium]|nr:enoyl-CoA hydratase-related protein [Deltaproteobacteria bacterium]
MEKSFSETVRYRPEYPLAWVELNRPQALNALNKEVFVTLGRIMDEIAADDQVKAVILTGSGEKAFAAGADVEEMKSLSALEAGQFALVAHEAQEKLSNLPKATIAALNGFTLGGGCELALCCDIRIASEKARLGQPEINLGIIPGGGGTQRLARLVGIAKAKELIFTGRIMAAPEALALGLVNMVVKPEELREAAKKLALEIAGKSAPALALAKRSIAEGAELPLSGALHYEIECFAQCFATEDHREGITAFLEKRAPVYRHG